MNYIVILTAKNEEQYIVHTLDSLVCQTIVPKLCIIVDDGSKDNTAIIAKKYLKNYSFIKVIEKKNFDEKRKGGSQVARAFNTGFKSLINNDYDIVVKLDADLILPKDYFEQIISTFIKYPKTGICGGRIINVFPDGTHKLEKVASHHIRGAFKAYRKKCFEDIGGIREVYNWDGVDEMLAMYYGWTTKTIDSEVLHLRPTSTLINKGLKSHFIAGKESYKEGYNVIIILIKAFLFSFKKNPKFLSGIGYFFGYIIAYLKQEPRYFNSDINTFFNKFYFYRIIKLRY